ncbi:MAG TPA: AMP-binding protein [Azospirillum sp.]|nr:AMP-binding protein [Azospirillum sp.]
MPSAHVDTFARSLLPPPALSPRFDYSADHLSGYPDRLNAASVLIDTAVAEGFGNKAALHYEHATWSYAHLHDQVDRIARVLVEDYGLVPGGRVLLRSANTPMVAACWLAVLKAGGICVTTMPLLRARELTYIIEKAQIGIALCEVGLAEEMELARAQVPGLKHVGYFTPLGTDADPDAALDRAVARKATGFKAVATAADDVALITFTSGTTGNPKGAVHFHRDILAVSDCWPRVYTLTGDEVVCGSPSFAFTYGIAAFLMYPLRYRATSVLVPRPTPDAILDAVQRYRVTSLYAVPTAFNTMLPELHRYDTGSLRKSTSAGEHLRQDLWDAWREATGTRIVNGIGASELLTHFISESLSVDRPGSTGRVVPGYSARLIDNNGNVLPPGSRGRLVVCGPTGCRYLDDPERQQRAMHDGWTVTGDVFEQDEDGYFWFVDRADDMIVSSGYNISPLEVERAILEHPKVAECAVVGVPDDARGWIVRACIVLHNPRHQSEETAREIQEFVKATIAPYKYPRDVKFLYTLPRTATGKLQRFRLREL